MGVLAAGRPALAPPPTHRCDQGRACNCCKTCREPGRYLAASPPLQAARAPAGGTAQAGGTAAATCGQPRGAGGHRAAPDEPAVSALGPAGLPGLWRAAVRAGRAHGCHHRRPDGAWVTRALLAARAAGRECGGGPAAQMPDLGSPPAYCLVAGPRSASLDAHTRPYAPQQPPQPPLPPLTPGALPPPSPPASRAPPTLLCLPAAPGACRCACSQRETCGRGASRTRSAAAAAPSLQACRHRRCCRCECRCCCRSRWDLAPARCPQLRPGTAPHLPHPTPPACPRSRCLRWITRAEMCGTLRCPAWTPRSSTAGACLAPATRSTRRARARSTTR